VEEAEEMLQMLLLWVEPLAVLEEVAENTRSTAGLAALELLDRDMLVRLRMLLLAWNQAAVVELVKLEVQTALDTAEMVYLLL
jgi:hypothetical protein